MRASNARNLCTLSGLLRSSPLKLKTSKPQSYPLVSSSHEDDFSDLDGGSHSTRNALEFERPSDSENLPDLVSKQISSMLSDQKKRPRGQVRKFAKSSTLESSILKDDLSELDNGPKLTSFKGGTKICKSGGAERKLSKGQIRSSSIMESSPQASSILEDDFSELDSENKLSSPEEHDFVQPSVSDILLQRIHLTSTLRRLVIYCVVFRWRDQEMMWKNWKLH